MVGSRALQSVGDGFQPNRVGLRQPPLQRYASVIFADDRHGFPVMQPPLGVGLGVGVVAIERDGVTIQIARKTCVLALQ